MDHTPLHAWLAPRLSDLVKQAEAASFNRDAAIGAIIDLITQAPYIPEPEPEPN